MYQLSVRYGFRNGWVRIGVVAMLAAAFLVGQAALAPSARATAGVVECEGSGSLHFSPGIKLEIVQRNIQITASGFLFGCADSIHGLTDPNRVVSGTWEATATASGDCVELTGNGTGTIHWITAAGGAPTSQTAASGTAAATEFASSLGTVTAGEFLGATVTVNGANVDFDQLAEDCETDDGLTDVLNVTGTGQLTTS